MKRNLGELYYQKTQTSFLLFRPDIFEVSSIHEGFICVKYWLRGSYAVPNIHKMGGWFL
jgi:hypothetical protein